MPENNADTASTEDEQAESLLADGVNESASLEDDDRIKKANREALTYRKQLRETQKELEKLRTASMTEQEKALTSARAEGEAEAAKKAAPRLVKAEFRASAAGRVDKQTLDAYLEDIDLTKFLDNNGEVDAQAIEARVSRLTPSGVKRTNFDGGARTSRGSTADMNALIRRAAGHG